jgi:hypothetical protein
MLLTLSKEPSARTSYTALLNRLSVLVQAERSFLTLLRSERAIAH